MKQFKVSPGGFREIRNQALFRIIPTMLIMMAGGIAISSNNSKGKPIDISVWLIYVLILGVAIGFGLYRGLSRQKKLYESYTLTIDNNLITRYQVNTPTISIYLNDIKEIIKHNRGGFTIKGKNPTEIIIIPAQIENYSELEMTLNQIKQLTSKKHASNLEKYQLVLASLTVGLMICVFTLSNKIIVGLSGALFVALMIWSLIEIQKSKNIDNKTKRSTWWILLVLVSVIAVVIMKIAASKA